MKKKMLSRLLSLCMALVMVLCIAPSAFAAEFSDVPANAWYHQALTAEFTIATGRRTKKQQLDPLHAAVSLDIPLADSEDITLGDTIPDKRAQAAFLDVEQRVDNDLLHAVLMGTVSALPGNQRAAILARYWGIGKPDSREERRAMKSLRHPRISMALRAFL